MSAPWGAGRLLRHEGLGVTQACPQAAAAQDAGNGLAQLHAAEWVDEGVHGGVQHGQGDDPVGAEQEAAVAGRAEKVHQQQEEEWAPAHAEDSHNGDDRLQQPHGASATPRRAQCRAVPHVQEDGAIEERDGRQHDEEEDEGEENVTLGVEGQEGGAAAQVAHAIPPQQGQEAYGERQNPAQCHHGVDAARLLGRFLVHGLHHGCVALHGNQQQAEDGCSQGHKQEPLAEQPERWAQLKGPAARHAQVDHVRESSQQVAEADVGDADVDPAAAQPDAKEHGEQDHQVLQDDEDANGQEDGCGRAEPAFPWLPVLQTPRVVVVLQDNAGVVQAVHWGAGCGWAEGVEGLHAGAEVAVKLLEAITWPPQPDTSVTWISGKNNLTQKRKGCVSV